MSVLSDKHPLPGTGGLLLCERDNVCVSVVFEPDTVFCHGSPVEREQSMAAEMFWISGPQFKRLTRGELSWTDICPVQELLPSLSDHSAFVCGTTFGV